MTSRSTRSKNSSENLAACSSDLNRENGINKRNNWNTFTKDDRKQLNEINSSVKMILSEVDKLKSELEETRKELNLVKIKGLNKL